MPNDIEKFMSMPVDVIKRDYVVTAIKTASLGATDLKNMVRIKMERRRDETKAWHSS